MTTAGKIPAQTDEPPFDEPPFTAGLGSDLIGPREITLIICGVAAAFAVLVYLFVPVVRDYCISGALRA